MANIIKIPSKYIYHKELNEISENKITTVDVVANDISKTLSEKNVYEQTNEVELNLGIINSDVSENNSYDLKEYFANDSWNEKSWAETVNPLKIKGNALFNFGLTGVVTDKNNTSFDVNFYVKYAELQTNITFNDNPDFDGYGVGKEYISFDITTSTAVENYVGISYSQAGNQIYFIKDNDDEQPAYIQGQWIKTQYKKILLGGTDSTKGFTISFANWLKQVSNYSGIEREKKYSKLTILNNKFYIDNILIYDFDERKWNSGYYPYRQIIFKEDEKISNRFQNWITKNTTPTTDNITIRTTNGYVSEYAYVGLKNYHTEFSFAIPKEINGEKVENIFSYPDIYTEVVYNHHTYSTNLTAKYAGKNYDIVGYDAYKLNEIKASHKLSSKYNLSDSLLSDVVNGYYIESTMSKVVRPDDITAGTDISAKLELVNHQDFNSQILGTEKDYQYKINVLSGVLFTKGSISANDIEDTEISTIDGYASQLSTNNGILEVYELTQFRIKFNGNVLTLDIQDGNLTFGDDKTAKFSIAKNELIQKSNSINGEKYIQKLANKVIDSYCDGKETAIITCGIAKYYDLSGNKILIDPTNENPDLPMIIPNNSIIVPYDCIVGSNGNIINVPMSTNKDGTPKAFLVVGNELKYDGVIRQVLYGIEITASNGEYIIGE